MGEFDAELAEEVFRAIAFNGGITLHLTALAGKNTHHLIEAAFKAFPRALRVRQGSGTGLETGSPRQRACYSACVWAFRTHPGADDSYLWLVPRQRGVLPGRLVVGVCWGSRPCAPELSGAAGCSGRGRHRQVEF